MARSFKVGDCVVYTRDKVGPTPGPRAKNVAPSTRGEHYSYEVEKYWRVTQILADDNIELVTRRGKTHAISISDPRLRRATWWEKLFLSSRFPKENRPPQAESNSTA